MSDARIGFGTVLSLDTANDPNNPNYTAIAEVAEIGPPEFSTDDVDVTHHQSPGEHKEHIPSLRDTGPIGLTVNWLPNDATQKATGDGLLALWRSRAVRTWRMTFPVTPAVHWTFKAYVSGFNPDTPQDDKMSAEVSLMVTGDPTLA